MPTSALQRHFFLFLYLHFIYLIKLLTFVVLEVCPLFLLLFLLFFQPNKNKLFQMICSRKHTAAYDILGLPNNKNL